MWTTSDKINMQEKDIKILTKDKICSPNDQKQEEIEEFCSVFVVFWIRKIWRQWSGCRVKKLPKITYDNFISIQMHEVISQNSNANKLIIFPMIHTIGLPTKVTFSFVIWNSALVVLGLKNINNAVSQNLYNYPIVTLTGYSHA